jgi:zinc protease
MGRGPLAGITGPRVVTETLGNGLTVLVHADRSQPLVAVSLRYLTGSRDEHPGRSGFAHLFEHLMFSGTGTVGRGEYLRMIQSIGGMANATTAADWTSYYSVAQADALELLLWLEADRLTGLGEHLDQGDLDAERAIVINERLQTVDNVPYGAVTEQLLASFFAPGHPYDHAPIGSITDLRAADISEVRAFFDSYYVPGRLVLGIVGGVAASAAIAAVRRHFGGIRRLGVGRVPNSTAALVRRGSASLSVPASEASARLFIGCLLPPAGSPDFESVRVAASALARGEGSVLIRGLVAQRGLAADVKIRVMPLQLDASLGIVEIVPRAGADLAEVAEVYFAEVARAARSRRGAHEQMARSLAQHEAHWCGRFDSVASRADELTWHAVMGARSRGGYEQPLRMLRWFSPADLARGLSFWEGAAGVRVLASEPASGAAGRPVLAGGSRTAQGER